MIKDLFSEKNEEEILDHIKFKGTPSEFFEESAKKIAVPLCRKCALNEVEKEGDLCGECSNDYEDPETAEEE